MPAAVAQALWTELRLTAPRDTVQDELTQGVGLPMRQGLQQSSPAALVGSQQDLNQRNERRHCIGHIEDCRRLSD